MATALEQNDHTALYAQIDDYDWEHDQEFQGGLRAILGSSSSPEQVAHLTLRAKCFYFARKNGTPIDFNDYLAWRGREAQQPVADAQSNTSGLTQANGEAETELITSATTSGTPAMGGAPTPASFADICQLIAEGKPIPGIKDIPDTVLEGQASTSTAQKRPKPWERETTTALEAASSS